MIAKKKKKSCFSFKFLNNCRIFSRSFFILHLQICCTDNASSRREQFYPVQSVTLFYKPESELFPITKLLDLKFTSAPSLLDGEPQENGWCPPSRKSRVRLTAAGQNVVSQVRMQSPPVITTNCSHIFRLCCSVCIYTYSWVYALCKSMSVFSMVAVLPQ